MIRRIAPMMQELSQSIGETITIAAFTGSHVVLIDVIEGTHALRWFSDIGKTMPFHASAPAKLFLAYMPEKNMKKIMKTITFDAYTEYTITDTDALLKELDKVRQTNTAYCINELDPYCTAVSVPVFDKKGDMIFALTVVGHSVRMTENAEFVLHNLRASAKKIESVMP